MKRIIDIPDKVVEAIQNGEDYRYDIHTAIAQSTPYNPSGDCISREALKEQVKNEVCEVCFDSPDERQCSPNCKLCTFKQLIDNAQTIPLPNEQIAWEQGYEAGLAQGKNDRPKGEWIECGSSDHWKCDKCGHPAPLESRDCEWLSGFCPNCGADMRGKGW